MQPTVLRLIIVCLTLLLVIACGDDEPSGSAPSPTKAVKETPSEAQPTPQIEPVPVQQQETMPAPAATQSTPTPEDTSATVGDDSNSEGLDLAKKSGCLACHAIDKKIVGPPWKDVAKRYAGDPNAKAKLIEKVSKGGRGNWTDLVGNVAMPPYSPRVSAENIENLVDFVLGLPSD
jgi:cytochrome c